MNLKRLFNKLLENKNFYYVIVALTIFHLISYAYRKLYKAISFLILFAIIVYNFNKKPVIVLLTSLIATHFFVAGNSIYEGLENNNSEDENKNKENIDALKNTDPKLARVAAKVSEGKSSEEKKDLKENAITIRDPNNPDTEPTTSTEQEPTPESFEGGKKGTVRLDHAATIETAYDDLQNILGSDGISKLTEDTKKLISQQKNLFTTMEQLTPAVKETMSMLEGLDVKGITGMSASATSVATQLQNMLKGNAVKPFNDKSNK